MKTSTQLKINGTSMWHRLSFLKSWKWYRLVYSTHTSYEIRLLCLQLYTIRFYNSYTNQDNHNVSVAQTSISRLHMLINTFAYIFMLYFYSLSCPSELLHGEEFTNPITTLICYSKANHQKRTGSLFTNNHYLYSEGVP